MKRGYHEGSRDRNRKRADEIKDRLTIPKLAEIRHARIKQVRGGHICDCPACNASIDSDKAVSIGKSGRTYICRTCGATGDVITFEMAATGKDFQGALADLELLLETPVDQQTGQLFAGDAA